MSIISKNIFGLCDQFALNRKANSFSVFVTVILCILLVIVALSLVFRSFVLSVFLFPSQEDTITVLVLIQSLLLLWLLFSSNVTKFLSRYYTLTQDDVVSYLKREGDKRGIDWRKVAVNDKEMEDSVEGFIVFEYRRLTAI